MMSPRLLSRRLDGGPKRPTPTRIGIGLYLALVIVLVLLAVKPHITSWLSDGEIVSVEFPETYKLREYDSAVKLAGMSVGRVIEVEETENGNFEVTMKVQEEALRAFGSDPTAAIEPRTVLGGRYVVTIIPGGAGEFDGTITAARQVVPTELDAVLEALPETAREAIQGLADSAPDTLAAGEGELTDLLESAPGVLRPGTTVVSAARGTRKQDLRLLVRDLARTTSVLTATDGQLGAIVDDLAVTSGVLAQNAPQLSAALAELPEAVRSARSGVQALDSSVGELREAAERLRPSAPRIATLLRELEPALAELEPVMDDLRPVLRDARPAVQELVPVARSGVRVLGDLNGPVLDRIKGPVTTFVLEPWNGTGPYSKSASGYQADHRFYEELAYMATNIDRASMTQDQYGSTLAFQAGAGVESVTDGLPFSIENIVRLALDHADVTGAARQDALRRAERR